MPKNLSIGDEFLLLEYEANQNGNTNWICFANCAVRFVGMAKRIRAALIEKLGEPVETGDYDDALFLLSGMILDNPHDLPTRACEQYQALRRVLASAGFLES